MEFRKCSIGGKVYGYLPEPEEQTINNNRQCGVCKQGNNLMQWKENE